MAATREWEFRPNDIGLSCVKLERVVLDEKNGPMLYVAGVDLMDQTPIYDIKPYIPFTDSHPDAKGGFSDAVKDYELEVSFPAHLLAHFPEEKREAVIYVLKQDPRPAYQRDETRRDGVDFAGFDVRFHVKGAATYRMRVRGARKRYDFSLSDKSKKSNGVKVL